MGQSVFENGGNFQYSSIMENREVKSVKFSLKHISKSTHVFDTCLYEDFA